MKQRSDTYLSQEEMEDALIYTLSDFHPGLPPWIDKYMKAADRLDMDWLEQSRQTIYCQVVCDQLRDENISKGDILVIDRKTRPRHGDLIACMCDGEFMVKKLCIQQELVLLIPSHPEHTLIRVTEKSNLVVVGVITYTIIKQRRME